jgi:hypothetical protein
VAQFFTLLRPICRYSFDIHDLGRRDLRQRGNSRLGANRINTQKLVRGPGRNSFADQYLAIGPARST